MIGTNGDGPSVAALQSYVLKTAAFTATAAGGPYALDTTAASFDVTIDAALAVGDFVDFADARGTWNTNPPTFRRNGHLIEGAEVDYLDGAQGTFLRVLNVGGTTGLRILESGTKPHNLTVPTISAGHSIGTAITASPGTWTGSPTSYAYQWQSSVDGTTWVDLSGATAASYIPVSGSAGEYIRVAVTANNANGSSLPSLSASSDALTQPLYPSVGLQAEWLFEDGSELADTSGNGHTLSNTNGVTFETDSEIRCVLGVSGAYVAFGGLEFSGDLTLAFRAKDTGESAGYRAILSLGNIQYYGYHAQAGAPAFNRDYASLVPLGTADADWHFMTARYTDGEWTFSRDDDTGSETAAGLTEVDVQIGDYANIASGCRVAQVRVWNRALTDAEIATVRANGTAHFVS